MEVTGFAAVDARAIMCLFCPRFGGLYDLGPERVGATLAGSGRIDSATHFRVVEDAVVVWLLDETIAFADLADERARESIEWNVEVFG